MPIQQTSHHANTTTYDQPAITTHSDHDQLN
jgi:hypothetical protein